MEEAEFIAAVLRNPINREILERMPSLGLRDVWLVAGALFQSAWNTLSCRAPDYGVKDYDLFYYDPDTSWEAEDIAIKRAAAVFDDVAASIEVRNQARVHLWYPTKFGIPYSALSSSTDGIDRFLMTCAQVGLSRGSIGYAVYAPRGFGDIEQMTIRPNHVDNFRADAYYAKAIRWQRLWPELTILSP
jgi:hypothetical protein